MPSTKLNKGSYGIYGNGDRRQDNKPLQKILKKLFQYLLSLHVATMIYGKITGVGAASLILFLIVFFLNIHAFIQRYSVDQCPVVAAVPLFSTNNCLPIYLVSVAKKGWKLS